MTDAPKIFDPTTPAVRECPWATAAVPQQTAKGVTLNMVRGPCNDRCALHRDGKNCIERVLEALKR